jgi:hypothetical protein
MVHIDGGDRFFFRPSEDGLTDRFDLYEIKKELPSGGAMDLKF